MQRAAVIVGMSWLWLSGPAGGIQQQELRGQLARECEQLMELMVRKPYGAAWAIATDERVKPGSAVVSMEPQHSPAAGLVLLWSGKLLEDDRIRQAGRDAARGAAACLSRSGMVLSRPTFGVVAGGREPPAYIPSRRATIAALGLMLAELDSSPPDARDEIIKRSAARATLWLLKQQARNGAWPSAYPDDVPGKDAARLIRLDDADFRDATLALFLAGEVLSNANATFQAHRACEILLRARLAGPVQSRALWATAYGVEATMLEDEFNFPDGADVLASRFVVQTLLSAYVISGREQYRAPLIEAADTLTATRLEHDAWNRFPNPGLTRRPSTLPLRGAASTRRAFEEPYPVGQFGLEAPLAALGRLKLTTHERFAADACATLSRREQLAATMCGLLDQPMSHEVVAKDFGDVGEDVRSRVTRIWGLFGRARQQGAR